MSDPIPGNDPNAAYDVVPSERWPKDWWTVTCNGIPVWHCPTGMKLAIERGWLWLHESGTFVKFTDAGAALFA
jgi:hypothetical protein